MNKIKFSYHYPKIEGCEKAELLQIFRCHYKDLSKKFINYDTVYFDFDHKLYQLPITELIILLFRNVQISHLFTTIRKYTPEKYEYYKSKMGEIFEVEIKEDLIEKEL